MQQPRQRIDGTRTGCCRAKPENKVCFDCTNKNPSWVSDCALFAQCFGQSLYAWLPLCPALLGLRSGCSSGAPGVVTLAG